MPSPNSFLRSCTSFIPRMPSPNSFLPALLFKFHGRLHQIHSFLPALLFKFHGCLHQIYSFLPSFLHFSFLVLQFRTATLMPSPNSFLPALLFHSTDAFTKFLPSCTSSPYTAISNHEANFSTAFHNSFYGTFSTSVKQPQQTFLPLSSYTHRQFHGVAFTEFNSFLHFSSSFLVLQFRTATRMPSPNSFLPALLF
jgi:hypothetical protein